MIPPHRAKDAARELGAELVDAAEYEAQRIALGVPRGGLDFAYSDAFPHEADMDQLGGVDFDKGCYVGQEVVSRMEHRGTARTRTMSALYDGAAPAPGEAVKAGDRALGTFGSAAAGHAVALVRLDRVADAFAAGAAIQAGGVPLRIVKPDWAKFEFPGQAKAAE
jgi:folate-binding protein YgfZ